MPSYLKKHASSGDEEIQRGRSSEATFGYQIYNFLMQGVMLLVLYPV